MRSLGFLIFSFTIILPVNAELLSSVPSNVCSFLSNEGLATRGWKNYYDDKYGCSSPYKEIGSGVPLANNLAFYADGTANSAKQVKLVMNINNRAKASSAHEELVRAAKTLTTKATGEQLPMTMQEFIRNGQVASQRFGSAMLEIIREDWPTGKGYEVKVIIK